MNEDGRSTGNVVAALQGWKTDYTWGKARALAHSLLWSWPSSSIMTLPGQCEQNEPFIPEVVFVRGSV